MKKTMKKVLALVLTVLMCVSVALPVVAADATCPGANADHTKANCSWTEIEKVAVGCGQDGYTLNKCNTCSKYFHDDIVPTTKNHEIKTGASVKPSCTQQGYDICKHCGAKFNIVEGSGEGHRYADFTAANKGVGKAWYPIATGKDCNYTKWESVCLNNWDNKGTNEGANCTTKTTKDYDGTLDNHEWILQVDSAFVAPTCSVAGTGTFKCRVCNTTKTLVIEATGVHTYTDKTVEYKAPTCTVPGNIATTACDECGEIPESAVIPALHDVDADADGYADCFEISLGLAATCTTAGYNLVYCPVCEHTDAQVIKSLGHDRGKLLDETAPTCAVPGAKIYERACTRCHELDSATGNLRADASIDATTGKLTITVPAVTSAHKLTFASYDATCESRGYTVYECTNEGCDHEQGKTFTTENTDPTNHVWVWTTTIPATCTTDGTKTAVCGNSACGVGNPETKTIPATGHKFYDVADDGTFVFTATYLVETVQPNCKDGDGYEVYRCMNAGCTSPYRGTNKVVYKNYTKALKYDANTLAHHVGAAANLIGVGNAGSCTVKGYDMYLCPVGNHVVNVYYTTDGVNGKHIRPAGYTTKVDATCDDPNTDAKEGEGRAEFWHCAAPDCDYIEGALKDKDGNYVDYNGNKVTAANAVGIKYPALTHKNLVKGKAPTCTADGYWATWDCDVCNTSFTSEGVYTYLDSNDEEQTVERDYVRPALNHNNGTAWTVKVNVTSTACLAHEYRHEVCSLCKADRIVGYDYNEHVWAADDTKTPATCEEGAYVLCTLGCGTKNYKSEKLGHIDADGNVIKCATAENFKCYRTCCADSDATTNCNKTSNSWLTTHNFVNTKFEATCTNYSYDLYVCVDCEYNYRVVHNGDEFQLAAHQWKTGSGIDAEGWKVTTEAKPGVQGVKTRECKVCGHKETKNYGAQLYYNISIDNGVVAGAQLVNSGLLKVTLKTTAANLDVWGLKFSLGFDHDKLAYEKFVVLNSAFKDSTIVATENTLVERPANPNDTTFVDLPETVNVVMTAPNTSAGVKQNVTLNGKSQGLVEVYFRILSNVGYNAETNTGSATAVSVGVASVEAIKYNANGDTAWDVAPVTSDNKTSGANAFADGTIYMLGDVTKDALSSNKVATMLDASALMEIITKNGAYNAMADIDKNGKIELADFAALMTYIADGNYNVLVSNGVN